MGVSPVGCAPLHWRSIGTVTLAGKVSGASLAIIRERPTEVAELLRTLTGCRWLNIFVAILVALAVCLVLQLHFVFLHNMNQILRT